jgi:hypothetical protein
MGWGGIAIGVYIGVSNRMGECIHEIIEGLKWMWARSFKLKKP